MLKTPTLALTVVAALILAACSTSPPTRDVAELISAGPTTGDHLQIAEFYTQKAAAFDAEAKSHLRMRQAYTSASKGQGYSMVAHCDSIIRNLQDASNSAKNLAKTHRDMASGTTQ